VPERLKLYEAIRSERASRIQEYSRLTGRDWVAGRPAYDSKFIRADYTATTPAVVDEIGWLTVGFDGDEVRAFEEYNFNHDEMVNSASAFKTWLEAKLMSYTNDEPLEHLN
jgi:hypothetical protein